MQLQPKLFFSLFGSLILFAIWVQLPFAYYEPSRTFHLPNVLWFIHLIFLYIHEAGHFFFRIFGDTLYILGGSLSQILVPVVWYIVAHRENSRLTIAALFFTGYSIVDVSVYVKDAGMLQLPLIGGLSKSHHDWATLMNNWGMIEVSYTFGEILFWCGMFLSAFAIYLNIRRAFTASDEQ